MSGQSRRSLPDWVSLCGNDADIHSVGRWLLMGFYEATGNKKTAEDHVRKCHRAIKILKSHNLEKK